jgi:pimeloyl-ACP methyl ester carboxylesterase
METVRSADGTELAYEVEGDGPPLVIVTGAFCDRHTTADLAALLADEFTVVRYDRRGRGDSGDAATYAVEREVEDLDAILGVVDGPASVYSHSSGASLALLAAAAGLPMTTLVAYEPPNAVSPSATEALRAALADALGAGDRGAAVKAFLSDAIGLPPEVVASAEHWPSWDGMKGIAHTLPYDVEVVAHDPGPALADIRVPTFVLHGGNSTDWSGDALLAAIPGAVGREIPGQDHGIPADAIAPELRTIFAGVG